MTKSNEYLESRCVINERVLHALANLIAAHLPAMQPQLQQIREAWEAAVDKLEADIPDGHNAGGNQPQPEANLKP